MSSWNDITTFNSFCGHPIFSRRWNRSFLLTRSNASVRSTKTTNRGCFCSRHFSCNCLRVKIMSVVGLCTLKPRCYSGCLPRLLQSLQCYTGEHFPQDAQQRNPSVVVTVAAITIALVEGDDICIAHVLGHVSFPPALTEELIEVVQESGLDLT